MPGDLGTLTRSGPTLDSDPLFQLHASALDQVDGHGQELLEGHSHLFPGSTTAQGYRALFHFPLAHDQHEGDLLFLGDLDLLVHVAFAAIVTVTPSKTVNRGSDTGRYIGRLCGRALLWKIATEESLRAPRSGT